MVIYFLGGFLACQSAKCLADTDYQVVHGWPSVPDGELLGAVAGVSVDSKDHVFLFRRAGRIWPENNVLDLTPIKESTVLVFDGKTGRLLNQWGANQFAMPHGITVDSRGNVWLTDVALHQVFKFSAEGKLLLKLGQAGVPGNDSSHFNRPTRVAVNQDGTFYVADGYRNTRVMKFGADGRFLFQWGTPGSGPGQFSIPHDIVVSSDGKLYVADRGNSRVQVFDSSGKYLDEWKSAELGRPYGLAISHGRLAYVVDGGDQPDSPPDRSAVSVVGINGKILRKFGRFGVYDGQFALGHCVAVDSKNSVYVGDITGQRIQKFVLSKPR